MSVFSAFHALKQQESEDLFCITLGGGTIGLMSVEVGEETAVGQEGLNHACITIQRKHPHSLAG